RVHGRAALLVFPFIGGTAVDPQGRDVNLNPSPASGVARVAVTLYRQSDYAVWDGANWGHGADYVYVNVVNGAWSLSLPPAAVSTDDHYVVEVSCCDRAGNCTSQVAVEASFTVDTKPPLP